MSDLSIYELEDIIWDDFDCSGDHIVPHPNYDHGSEEKYDGDSSKKRRREVKPLQSNAETLYASGTVSQVKEDRDSNTLNSKRNLMEKDLWSQTPDGVFTASRDAHTAKDIPSLQSGDARMSNHCFKSSNVTSGSDLCTDDRILNDTSVAADSNSYDYSLSHINQTDGLNLFSNDCDDKESSDLLYYGWPDIGNFEDVDRMLSNCDSSFGLGVTGNDDELVWFTSECPDGDYDEASKMDLNFPCLEPSSLTNISQDHEPPESDNKRSSCTSESKDEFKLKDQKKHQNQIKSENKGVTSPSPMETYHASNQVHSMESSGPSFSGNQKQKSTMLEDSRLDLVSSQKQSDTEGVDTGWLDIAEGSSVSSELDEISLETTSFRQLQQVMERLDTRTKLCIRDSLYRLARSAEQRHNHGGPLPEGTNSNRCDGLMDMETDTNPIDRTIAHLLFHRPSDSSK